MRPIKTSVLAHLHEAARCQVAPAHVRLDQARAAQQRQSAPPLPPHVQRLRSTQPRILRRVISLGVLEVLSPVAAPGPAAAVTLYRSSAACQGMHSK